MSKDGYRPLPPIRPVSDGRSVNDGRPVNDGLPPLGRDGDEEDDDFGLPVRFFSAEAPHPPRPLPPPQALRAGPRLQQQQQQQESTPLPLEPLKILSTYDKGDRGKAEEDVRISAMNARIRRSRAKEETQVLDGRRSVIDDNLLKDKIGATVSVYENHAQYTGNLRTKVPPKTSLAANVPDEGQQDDDDDDQQGDDYDGGGGGGGFGAGPMEIDDADVFLQEDNDDEEENESAAYHVTSNPPREILYPVPAVPMASSKMPDTEQLGRIDTFQEYAAPQKGRPQFDRTMQHIGGKEQTYFVEVVSDEERYKHVQDTLNEKIGKHMFLEYAIRNDREIPVLPPVTRAEVRDSRAESGKGEISCIKGERCESYQYTKDLIETFPEIYNGFKPWSSKEFYFGEESAIVRQGIALGETPDKIKHAPVMCVMCHEQCVTALYKTNKMNLNDPTTDPHILHAYQYIIGPGEYSPNIMLMGDNTFRGIAAPFIRYQRDNYMWIPDRTGAPQRWIEKVKKTKVSLCTTKSRVFHSYIRKKETMDFDQGVV